jgi:hypothetical protein
MSMRVAGKPAGDSGQVRLAQSGGLLGRVVVASPPGDSRWGGLRAPETQARNAGARQGHPGRPEEGPGHPGRAEGQRHPDALRWAQGQGAAQTQWRTLWWSHPPIPGPARRSPPGKPRRYGESTTPPQASLTDVPHALTCEDPGLLSAIGEFPVKTQAGCVAAAGQTQGGGHE